MSHPASTVRAMGDLTDTELAILAFEKQRWLHQGAKDETVLKEFGLTPVRYQQVVQHLIDRPEAYLAEPVLIKRLRRLRDTRRRRTGRSLN